MPAIYFPSNYNLYNMPKTAIVTIYYSSTSLGSKRSCKVLIIKSLSEKCKFIFEENILFVVNYYFLLLQTEENHGFYFKFSFDFII